MGASLAGADDHTTYGFAPAPPASGFGAGSKCAIGAGSCGAAGSRGSEWNARGGG